MKRTPLQRKTRLVAKRPTLTPEERDGRKLVSRRSGGWCELRIEGVCLGRATNYQHRRAEGQGGPTTASNGLDVCGMGNATGCHGFLHQNPNLAEDNGWTVKSWDDWRATKVVLWNGDTWLDDEGGFEPPVPPCPLGCAVWTSNENCDCEDQT